MITQDKAIAKQELPEDFTSAWASVLLDLWEKRSRPDRRADVAHQDDHQTKSTPVTEDVADDE